MLGALQSVEHGDKFSEFFEIASNRVFQGVVVEAGGRVVKRQEPLLGLIGGDIFATEDPAMDPRDTAFARQETIGTVATKEHDHVGLNELNLPSQIRPGRLDLFRFGITILGGTGVDEVRNEDISPLQSNQAEHLVEEPARGTNEGLALLIFVEPRRLANEHDPSLGASLAWNSVLGASHSRRVIGAANGRCNVFERFEWHRFTRYRL